MELNKYIEHTNLNMSATHKEIETLCEEAKKYHFETVCVHPFYVALAKELLHDSNVGITTVIGFPFGMNTVQTKEYEAIDAIHNGADEIDMIMNIGCVKNREYDLIKKEIETIRDSIDGHSLKVSIEACDLEEDQISRLIELCNETFIHFIQIKVLGDCDEILDMVELIKQYKSDVLEIKVSGDIQTEEDVIKMIEAGVTRIGTSHGVNIVSNKEHSNCSKECGYEHCHCEDIG